MALCRQLFLSEKSSLDGVGGRSVWSHAKEIGYAGTILGNQRQRPGATRLGFGSSLQEHASEPVLQRVNNGEVSVLFLSVRMSSNLPVFRSQQVIPQESHATERHGQSLPEGGVTR